MHQERELEGKALLFDIICLSWPFDFTFSNVSQFTDLSRLQNNLFVLTIH